MYILSTLFLLVITALLYLYLFLKKSHKFFDKYGIPYPKPHWLFGNMKDVVFMKKTMWVALRELYEKFPSDRFVGAYTLHKPVVVVRDPELIKLILVKDFSHFHDHGFSVINKEVEPLAYHLLSISGDEWKALRMKMTGTFTSGKMKKMFPLVKKCAEDIKPVLTTYYQQGQDFEAKDLCARYTTDVIGSCAFGIDTHSLQDPDSEFQKMVKSIFTPRWQAFLRSLLPNTIPVSLIKLFKLQFISENLSDYFIKTIRDMVRYREENNITRGDFLDLLIALKNHKKTEKVKDEQAEADLTNFMAQIGEKYVKNDVEMTIEMMAAQCFIFFVAGLEGSSSALMFMLFELTQHPEMQCKLREEILSALESNAGELTYEMIKKMPYLDMVIAETMRKYPLNPALFRKCTETYKIPESNAIIKEGTAVLIPSLGLHFDKKYYENPEGFNPEHFSPEAKLKRHHFAYLPFGEGPRVCIGERFARMQILVGAIHLLKDFSFELSPKTIVPLELLPSGIFSVKGGMWLRCQPL